MFCEIRVCLAGCMGVLLAAAMLSAVCVCFPGCGDVVLIMFRHGRMFSKMPLVRPEVEW